MLFYKLSYTYPQLPCRKRKELERGRENFYDPSDSHLCFQTWVQNIICCTQLVSQRCALLFVGDVDRERGWGSNWVRSSEEGLCNCSQSSHFPFHLDTPRLTFSHHILYQTLLLSPTLLSGNQCLSICSTGLPYSIKKSLSVLYTQYLSVESPPYLIYSEYLWH